MFLLKKSCLWFVICIFLILLIAYFLLSNIKYLFYFCTRQLIFCTHTVFHFFIIYNLKLILVRCGCSSQMFEWSGLLEKIYTYLSQEAALSAILCSLYHLQSHLSLLGSTRQCVFNSYTNSWVIPHFHSSLTKWMLLSAFALCIYLRTHEKTNAQKLSVLR